MKTENMILTTEICAYHNIEITFIRSLHETGLIEITRVDSREYILTEHLKALEQMIHLHTDLAINLEGIETITHLLRRVNGLQTEIKRLQNRLDFYEMEP